MDEEGGLEGESIDKGRLELLKLPTSRISLPVYTPLFNGVAAYPARSIGVEDEVDNSGHAALGQPFLMAHKDVLPTRGPKLTVPVDQLSGVSAPR